MMKKITYSLGFVLYLLVFSCQKPNNTVNFVLDNYQSGAVLRTISASGEYNFYAPGESTFKLTIEEHDKQNGALMKNVEVYLSFNGGTEKLHQTIAPSEFTTGPVGLPRIDLSISFAQAIATLGLSSGQYKGGDKFDIRLQLNLTDGRSYSAGDVTGSLTGSYFKSPYKYTKIIKCIPISAIPGIYTIEMIDSYGDGWNGASIDVTIDGVTTSYSISADQKDKNTVTITIPESASTMTFSFTSGEFDSEVTYSIKFTNLDGTNAQTAISDGPSPAAGEKTLSICQ